MKFLQRWKVDSIPSFSKMKIKHIKPESAAWTTKSFQEKKLNFNNNFKYSGYF